MVGLKEVIVRQVSNYINFMDIIMILTQHAVPMPIPEQYPPSYVMNSKLRILKGKEYYNRLMQFRGAV